MKSEYDFEARTCQHVYQDGEHYLVISTEGGWRRYRITESEASGLVQSILPRVLRK